MESVLQDLRQAARTLRRSPGFTAVAVLTLALGIGANTAVFSVVNGVVLRPLPFVEPDRLVLVSESFRGETVERRSVSYLDFLDWRDRARSFGGLAAFAGDAFTLAGDAPERVPGELVSAEYFDLLGVGPARGRAFLAEEDRGRAGEPVAMLGHDLWRRRFGGDPDVIGRSVELNGRLLRVVGLMPEGFRGLTDAAEVWVPIGLAEVTGRGDELGDRRDRWHGVVGRLRPGVTRERAQSEMDAVTRALEREHPADNADRGALVLSLEAETFGSVRSAALVLLGAVAFVLLMGCANLANLTLARGADRRRELALRAALGAGRGRLARQLLAESALVAAAGGLAGLAVASWGVDLLAALSPVPLPSFVRLSVDLGALAFTAAISLLTALAFGLAPAIASARADLEPVLREGGRGAGEGPGRRRASAALVVSQVALALVLLVGAGLTIRSFARLASLDPGFRPEGVVTLRVDLPEDEYTPADVARFTAELAERVRGLPAVDRVAMGTDTPLDGNWSARMGAVEVEGAERDFRFYVHSVSPGWLAALGIPLRAGRDVSVADVEGAPAVAIVGEALARRFWPGGDPVGQRIRIGGSPSEPRWASVVGVVGEARHRSFVDDASLVPQDPDVYLPLAQAPDRALAVVARTRLEPAALAAAIGKEVHALDPSVPVSGVETLRDRVRRETAVARFTATLLAAFAAVALALAGAGIYGVLAYTVSRRTREVGIRMALGARRADVLGAVVGRGMGLALAGLAIGLVAALALTRVLRGLLVGVSATEPTTFAAVAFLLAAVALFASWVPARRATRVDPATVLRAS